LNCNAELRLICFYDYYVIVNVYSFQDYYVIVNEPLDLSKVLLKFHGGSYHNLNDFTKDMRSMFDNYKNFFRDSKTEVILLVVTMLKRLKAVQSG